MGIELNKTYFGDCRDVLRQFIADGVKVHCVVTSPPFFNLRDYGTGTWEGGSPDCDHLRPPLGGHGKETLVGTSANDNGTRYQQYRDVCGKCGARRIDQQIGLENSPDEYVNTLVEVFRLVWDILDDTGTVWLNLGSSYASQGGPEPAQTKWQVSGASDGQNGGRSRKPGKYKPKDLIPIPWLAALALQADGWYLRSEITWCKRNPLPESVTDRPTNATEKVFLLTKSQRYYYDYVAVQEPATHAGKQISLGAKSMSKGQATAAGIHPSGNALADEYQVPDMRNMRNYMLLSSENYKGSHFATFPTKLITPFILAGCPAQCCSVCGKPWERVVEKTSRQNQTEWHGNARRNGCLTGGGHVGRTGQWMAEVETIGFRPTCTCNAESIPGIVLDLFMGSGTTAQVAQQLGRRWLGIELNPDYAKLQAARTQQLGLSL